MKKIITFVSIFIIILIAYFAAHAGVYLSIVEFFSITSALVKIILLEVLIFLGGSFLLATVLSHFKDNVFTRVYYLLAASWLGILTNLILFLGLGWLVKTGSEKLDIAVNAEIIGIVAIFYAFALSIYGAWNAFTPSIKHLEISLKKLPKKWNGKKIVLITDVHFGNIFTERYAHDLADQINSMNPDMIMISGDLFDGTSARLDTFIAPLNKLDAPKGVYYVTGNHETYLEQHHLSIISKTKIIQLRDEMKVLDGLQIIGIDFPKSSEFKDVGKIIKHLPKFKRTIPSILLWHTPTQIENIRKAGISLLLSGHTHKGQLFPFGCITKLIYRGYDYGFKRKGSLSVYISSGLGGWGPPMRTEKRSEIVEIILS